MSETKAAILADRLGGGEHATTANLASGAAGAAPGHAPGHAPSAVPSGAPIPPHASAAGNALLFLREDEIRSAQDMLFFAYRDFTNAADMILAELDLGRAHHRALHFIGRNPAITVSELLGILRITKQSLARVLTALVEQGYVAQAPGRSDRRQRLLTLTPAGQALERRLFERQRERLVAAYREAGASAVEGFRRVLHGIMNEDARRYMDAPTQRAADRVPERVAERPAAVPTIRAVRSGW